MRPFLFIVILFSGIISFTQEVNQELEVSFQSVLDAQSIKSSIKPNKPKSIQHAILNKTYSLDSYTTEHNFQYVDSTIEFQSKNVYTYYSPTVNIDRIEFDWDKDNEEWIQEIKRQYVFNENEYLDTLRVLSYNASTGTWSTSGMEIFRYNELGFITEETLFHSLSTPYYRDIYEYDTEMNLIQHIFTYWDSESNVWDDFWKDVYVYDANNNLISHTEWSLDNNCKFYIHEYQYDDDDRLVIEINQEYNFESEELELSSKYESTYDLNNMLLTRTQYSYDFDSEAWLVVNLKEYSYDEQSRLISEIESIALSNPGNLYYDRRVDYTYAENDSLENRIYFNYDSDWEQFMKREHVYNENDNLIFTNTYTLDDDTGSWLLNSYYRYEYYPDLVFADVYIPYSENNLESILNYGPLKTRSYHQWFSDHFCMQSRYVFYYNGLSNSNILQESNDNNCTIYPNPTSSMISIDCENVIGISVYRNDGVEILKAYDQNEINLGAYSPGLYLIIINTDTGTYFKKIILQ